MKKVIKFLDKHRILLVFLILLFIVIIFISVNSFLFLHHEFKAYNCNENIDDIYCYYGDKKIFINPEISKKKFFYEYKKEIAKLVDEYNLDEFNYYTAYYYFVAARLNYQITGEYKVLEDFFLIYVNSYDLEKFYLENNFYFNIFYHYKIY